MEWLQMESEGILARIIHDGNEMSANYVAIRDDDFAKSHQRVPPGAPKSMTAV
jgi:hypothetical protein